PTLLPMCLEFEPLTCALPRHKQPFPNWPRTGVCDENVSNFAPSRNAFCGDRVGISPDRNSSRANCQLGSRPASSHHVAFATRLHHLGSVAGKRQLGCTW